MKDPQAWPEYCKSLAPAIVETCTHTAVNTGPAGLVAALGNVIPEWKFRHAFSRGGWYRLGGVYDGAGERVSDALEAWVEGELEARGGDLDALLDDYAGQGHYASRLVGQTHYLVAPSGEGAGDFLQLEVECLQEVRAHDLFSTRPDNVEDLIDPPRTANSAALLPIGLPTYTFRRLQHVGDFLRRMLVQKPEPAPIHRMLADWDRTSAGIASAFSNHWVILTQEHQDRFQQPVLHARPLATLAGPPPEFSADESTRGVALGDALIRFNRAVGYPMAWYFHMLTTKAVPYWVAQAVVEDALAGFAYLPEKDVAVVRDWLHRPYSV